MGKSLPVKGLALLVIMSLAVFGLVGCDGEEEEVSPEEFYDGADVTLASGSEGGGTDTQSRLFADAFQEKTGANVIVENYDQLGDLEALNVAYDAEPDGLTMGTMMGGTAITNWFFEEPGILYDMEEFEYIGGVELTPNAIWVHPEGPVNTLDKLQEGEDLVFAGASPLGTFAVSNTFGGHVLDCDFETLIGVGGPGDCKMAVERQEVDTASVAIHTPGFKEDLKALVLVASERHDYMPDVPALPEVADLTEQEERWLEMVEIVQLAPFYVFPPDTPEERVEYVQDVFMEITTDEEFVQKAVDTLGAFDSYSGEEAQEIVNYVTENEDEFEELVELIRSYYMD